jgi:hypothetical protein
MVLCLGATFVYSSSCFRIRRKLIHPMTTLITMLLEPPITFAAPTSHCFDRCRSTSTNLCTQVLNCDSLEFVMGLEILCKKCITLLWLTLWVIVHKGQVCLSKSICLMRHFEITFKLATQRVLCIFKSNLY